MSDRFRAVVWEKPCLEKTRLADVEMGAGGYGRIAIQWFDVVGKAVWVGLYERRPPTAEDRLEELMKAGKRIDYLLMMCAVQPPWSEDDDIVTARLAWHEAIGCEEVS